jgi:hypothetical protein
VSKPGFLRADHIVVHHIRCSKIEIMSPQTVFNRCRALLAKHRFSKHNEHTYQYADGSYCVKDLATLVIDRVLPSCHVQMLV